MYLYCIVPIIFYSDIYYYKFRSFRGKKNEKCRATMKPDVVNVVSKVDTVACSGRWWGEGLSPFVDLFFLFLKHEWDFGRFSTHKRLKTYVRNTTGQSRSNRVQRIYYNIVLFISYKLFYDPPPPPSHHAKFLRKPLSNTYNIINMYIYAFNNNTRPYMSAPYYSIVTAETTIVLSSSSQRRTMCIILSPVDVYIAAAVTSIRKISSPRDDI